MNKELINQEIQSIQLVISNILATTPNQDFKWKNTSLRILRNYIKHLESLE